MTTTRTTYRRAKALAMHFLHSRRHKPMPYTKYNEHMQAIPRDENFLSGALLALMEGTNMLYHDPRPAMQLIFAGKPYAALLRALRTLEAQGYYAWDNETTLKNAWMRIIHADAYPYWRNKEVFA